MGTLHEDAARDAVNTWMATPAGASALQVYVAGLREGRWSTEYCDTIGQSHQPERPWPLEQVLAFAKVHDMVMSGDVAVVSLSAGGTPAPDRLRQQNAGTLAHLPAPFAADVDLHQNGRDQDGTLHWTGPITMERSVGVPFTDPCGNTTPVKAARTVAPGRAPLEIGTTQPTRTLLHLHQEGAVARWPYGHWLIHLLVRVG